MLPVIRAAKLIDDTVIKTPLTEKGNPSFKLSDLMQHHDAHGAVPDTEAVKSLSEIIYKNPRTKPIWDSSLMTLSRQECGDLLSRDKIVTHTEWFYGRLRMYVVKFLFSHPAYNAWALNWDLQHSPEDYIKMEYNDLKKALVKPPKIIRTIKTNRSSVLLNPSYGLKSDPYKMISKEEMFRRAKILDDSTEFLERVYNILKEVHEEKSSKSSDKENLQPEETLYSGGFASEKDSDLMEKFHSIEWKDRVNLIEKFSDERYSFFEKKIIYQESPEVIPEKFKSEIKKNIASRLFSTEKQQWTTIPEFYKSIDDMRNKHENDAMIMKKLDEYNQFVMEIEKKYEARLKDLNRYHFSLQECIRQRKEWISYLFIKLRWRSLRSEVEQQMSQKNPLISLTLAIIYLPTKILKFFHLLKLKYELEETEKEIEVLEKELLIVDHLRWNKKDNDHLKLSK